MNIDDYGDRKIQRSSSKWKCGLNGGRIHFGILLSLQSDAGSSMRRTSQATRKLQPSAINCKALPGSQPASDPCLPTILRVVDRGDSPIVHTSIPSLHWKLTQERRRMAPAILSD